MNRQIKTQATAFALALLFTLAMLGSVERIATAEPPASLVAHVMQGAAHS
jgi:hypothetical protein